MPAVFSPPFFLGIDLGGTNIKSGVVDDHGRPLSSISLATEADQGPVVGLDNLVAAGQQGRQEERARLGPHRRRRARLAREPWTFELGMLLDPPNLPGWDNLPIRQLLADRLRKPVVLQNDGNAAAYGEYWAGAARNTHSLVMFTLGTGVGGGIVVGGTIIEGRHSHGGECGHIIIEMPRTDAGAACGAYWAISRRTRRPRRS